MKKLKHLLSWLIVFMLIFSIMPTSVFASPCCYAQVDSVTESDGEITISYSFFTTNSEARQMRLSISEVLEGSYFQQVYTDTFTQTAGEYTYTLDSINLLNGVTYQARVDFCSSCEWDACDSAPGVQFTVTDGMPHFYLEDLPNGALDLVGKSRAAVTATTSNAGFYSISAADEYNNIKIGSYPRDYRVDNYEYYDAKQKVTFIISTYDESDLSTTITFGPAVLNMLPIINTNPVNGDKLINISDYIGLCSFTVPKYGLYTFDYSQAEEVFGNFSLYDSDGDLQFNSQNSFYGEPIEQPLFAGTYYLDTANMEGEYDLSITYTVPDEIKYGTSYYIGKDASKYFYLNAAQPAYITLEGSGMKATLQSSDKTYYLNTYEPSFVIPTGNYYVEVGNEGSATDVIDEEFTINAEFIETMSLDTPITPSKQYLRYGNYYYYIAFCAPEADTYEFDFSKCNGYDFVNEYGSSDLSYVTREMEKGEWALISMSNAAEISVSKYTAPAPVALTYDVASTFEWVSGKTYAFTFTPEEDGLYKFVSENCFCNEIKIYTDSEVIYETDDPRFYSTTVELKKNVPVYITMRGTNYVWSGDGYTNDIKVTTPYIKDNGTVDIMGNNEPTYVYCTADTSGYYQLSMQRVYDYKYSSIRAYINGRYYYVDKYSPTQTIVYIEAGEPLEIKCTYDSDSSCQMDITLVSVLVQEIEFETNKNVSGGAYYTFTAPKDGVYKISKILPTDDETDEDVSDEENNNESENPSSGGSGNGGAGSGTIVGGGTDEGEGGSSSGNGGNSSGGGGSTIVVPMPDVPEIGTEEGSAGIELLASNAAGGSGSVDTTIRIEVSSAEAAYLAFTLGTDAYFMGEAGTTYLIAPGENMELVITDTETTEFKLGTEYTTGKDVNIFEVDIPADGLYRVKTPEMCNTDIVLNFNGEWYNIYEYGHSLFELNAGKTLIITSPYYGYDEWSAPKARFKLEKATTQAKLGTELIDVYYDISWGCPVIECSVKAPYEIEELGFGIEFTNDAGSFVSETIRYVDKYYTDKVYETIATDLLEKGKTYKVKPFITVGEESEKIYGTEKTVTVDMQDTVKAKYNTVKVPVKLHNGNTYTKYEEVTIEFTQPEDAQGRTYITYPEFMYPPSVYDENGEYMPRYSDENGDYYYSLVPDITYYASFSIDYDCVAEIGISSLPNPPEEVDFVISDEAILGNTISFNLAGVSASDVNLFAALYSDSGKMVELIPVKNPPEGANSINYTDASAKKCKLMIMEDRTFKPLCDDVEIDIVK